jgi:hypothetical protein
MDRQKTSYDKQLPYKHNLALKDLHNLNNQNLDVVSVANHNQEH